MNPAAPLNDLLVVDLSRYLPGPLVARLLADLGARVIKVEEPRLGDPCRQAVPSVDGTAALAALLLSGHESLALDLKKETARRCLEELLITADVLIDSFRPGVLEGFGLGPDDLRRRYPRLIHCAVTGWGQDGPEAHRPGHDLTYQAIAGSLAGSRGMPSVQTADVVGAWSAATSVLAALHRRGRDGQGSRIDAPLLDAAGHAAITAWSAEAHGPRADGEPLMLTGALPCYALYPTKNGGRLALAALEPKFWQRFCELVERPDLLRRQYDTSGETHREVEAIAGSRTRAEWADLLRGHDIPADPVLTPAEALEHPQVRARELLRPAYDGLARLGFPARFDGERPRGGDTFPVLGEHTERLVKEFGLAQELSGRQRRAGGVGRKFSLKRWAAKLRAKASTRKTSPL